MEVFHFYHKGDKFVFGSELKQFTADPEISKELDLPFLSAYMAYCITDYNERTMLEEIKVLRPEHNLLVSLSDDCCHIKSVETRRYWDLKCEYDYSVSVNGWIERIRAEFARSVAWRLRSDVPVGARTQSTMGNVQEKPCVRAVLCLAAGGDIL